MIAKLASEKNKPDGIHIVENDADKVMQFMAELPVRKVPGIGNVMEQILTGLGVNTC
jgi:DNA polymerase kappa